MSEYKSTIVAIEDFLNSTVWLDFQHEFNMWIDDIRKELEAPDRTPDIYLVRQLQGNIEFARKALQMPYEIINNIKEDLDRKEKAHDVRE
jgi:hypothetical protein